MNRVVLMGRLVADPELKNTPAGVSVTTFRIAVDRRYVKQGEQRQADFFDIVVWRQTAEFVCKYFSKGQLIALEGTLQSRTYQDKNGNNRYVVEVIADNVYFTGDRRTTSSGQVSGGYSDMPEQPEQKPAYVSGSTGDFEEMPLDDDLPF